MLTIKDLMRARSILRWSTVNVSIPQNISEHSHCMALLAEDLLERINPEAPIEHKYYLIKYCNYHDLPELIQGDWPASYKLHLKEMVPGLAEQLEKDELHLVPQLNSVKEFFNKYPYLEKVAKLSDIIEAYSFLSVNGGGDDEHISIVKKKLVESIHSHVASAIDAPEKFGSYRWDAATELLSDAVRGPSGLNDFENNLKSNSCQERSLKDQNIANIESTLHASTGLG